MAWKMDGFWRCRTASSVRSRSTGSRRSVGTSFTRAMKDSFSDRRGLALPVEQALLEPGHEVVGADGEEGEDDEHHEDARGVEGAGSAGKEEAQTVLRGEHLAHYGGGESESHGDAQPREDPRDARG